MRQGIYARYIKRLLDRVLSGVALIVLSPVMAVTACLVRIRLGSPVIFCQERPGKHEKIFRMYKFRTMTDTRDKRGRLLPDEKRLTSFGNFLRRTSLDELPELWNIFKGDMSIVGPRPLLCSYLPYYTKRERLRHRVMPGLTGLAQVNGRNLLAWDDRLEMDAVYAEHITFLGDLKILLKTVEKVFQRDGVAVDTATVEPNLAEERKRRRAGGCEGEMRNLTASDRNMSREDVGTQVRSDILPESGTCEGEMRNLTASDRNMSREDVGTQVRPDILPESGTCEGEMRNLKKETDR